MTHDSRMMIFDDMAVRGEGKTQRRGDAEGAEEHNAAGWEGGCWVRAESGARIPPSVDCGLKIPGWCGGVAMTVLR